MRGDIVDRSAAVIARRRRFGSPGLNAIRGRPYGARQHRHGRSEPFVKGHGTGIGQGDAVGEGRGTIIESRETLL